MRMLGLLLGCTDAPEGAFALAYAGQPDCVTVADAPVTLQPPFTVELWATLDIAAIEADHPLVAWDGLFELGLDTADMLSLSIAGKLATAYALPVERDVTYNITASYDGVDARLFLDGELVTLAAATTSRAPGTTLHIGCNSSVASFWGTLDDVRISKTARYTESFTTSPTPYEADADTLVLFPFDEGEGEEATDVASGVVATVAGPTWVAGKIGASP